MTLLLFCTIYLDNIYFSLSSEHFTWQVLNFSIGLNLLHLSYHEPQLVQKSTSDRSRQTMWKVRCQWPALYFLAVSPQYLFQTRQRSPRRSNSDPLRLLQPSASQISILLLRLPLLFLVSHSLARCPQSSESRICLHRCPFCPKPLY